MELHINQQNKMEFNEKNNGITEANLYQIELTDFPWKGVEFFMH